MILNEREAQAVANLLETDDFKIYMEAIGTFAEKSMKNLVHAKQEDLLNRQARVQTITEIIKALDKAQQTVNDLKNRG